MRIGIITPRYGARIYGGAEVHAREYARVLRERGHDVEVLCTTSHSADTWLPSEAEGVSVEDGISVRRFDAEPRQWLRYDRAIRLLESGGPTDDSLGHLEDDLGKSPRLLAYLQEHSHERDVWIFMPYLFSTTVDGIALVERSVLVPCLHDEPLARRPKVAAAFQKATRIWYNTPEEADLGQKLHGRSGNVVSLGFSPPATPPVDLYALRRTLGLPPRYVLYVGRLEHGKGLPVLLEWYAAYRKSTSQQEEPVGLVVTGSGHWNDAWPAGVTWLPAVDQSMKWALYAGSLVYCQPSLAESLSIGMMEAWMCGVPVLVRAGCPVTMGHIRRGHGGLVIDSSAEFTAAISLFQRLPVLRRRLADSGRRYVNTNYSWSVIGQRLDNALEEVASIAR